MRIQFIDFWDTFNPHDFFTKHLLNGLNYEIVEDNPDVIFYSCFGTKSREYNCKKIQYIGENMRPDPTATLSLSFEENSETNCYLPLFVIQYYGNEIHNFIGSKGKDTSILFKHKMYESNIRTNFCAFIYSNGRMGQKTWWGTSMDGIGYRTKLFHYLNSKKKISSGGPYLNNIGYQVTDKIDYLKTFKFCFAIENADYPGYITEKLLDAMLGGSVPIYWGSNTIGNYFNEKSFINGHNFNSIKDLGDYIIDLDNSDDEYKKIIYEPYVLDKTIFNLENIKLKIKQIID